MELFSTLVAITCFVYCTRCVMNGHPHQGREAAKNTRKTTRVKRTELGPKMDSSEYEYTHCSFQPSSDSTEHVLSPINCPQEFWTLSLCGAYYDCVCCEHKRATLPGKAYCKFPMFNLTSVPSSLPRGIRMLNLVLNSLVSEDLTREFFANVPHITHLFLPHNNITWLDRQWFTAMPNLTCFNLDNNNHLTLQAVTEALSIPGLSMLSTTSCSYLPAPSKNAFLGVNSTVWRLFFIDNSPAHELDLTAFCALHNLQDLRLDVLNVKDLLTAECNNVTLLSLQSNALDRFPTTRTGDKSLFPKLESLSLSNNNLVILNPDVVYLPNLTYLDLTGTILYRFRSGQFNTTYFPRLKILDLSFPQFNTIDTFIKERKFFAKAHAFQSSVLTELYLFAYEIPFEDTGLVSGKAFRDCPSLEIIDLSRNNFRYVDEERFFELFGGLRALRVMNMSDSQVEIGYRTFLSFHNLTHLDLSGNYIVSLPDGFVDSLKRLVHIDLSSNRISVVTAQTFGEQTRNRLQYLGLGRTPFMCDCRLVWFTNWFRCDPALFVDSRTVHRPREYQCSNLDNTPLTDFRMVEQACMLGKMTSVLITTICSILILSFTSFTLVFRYRWHLRLIIYEVFRGQGNARRRRLLHNVFDFDVFLAYAADDLPWVRQHLMPELEDRLGLRMCIHERDFIAGNPVVDNIAECVEKSKKIMMVFSKHFMRSQWCQFELAFCQRHVMDYDDSLIIIRLPGDGTPDMTPAMMAVLKTTTYIQWREEPDAVRSFWGRVKMSLREIMQLRRRAARRPDPGAMQQNRNIAQEIMEFRRHEARRAHPEGLQRGIVAVDVQQDDVPLIAF